MAKGAAAGAPGFIPTALLLVACAVLAQADDALPAWQRRGNLTDEKLAALSQRLDPFRARLERAVENFPDLAAKLAGTQSGPTRIGWQVLPRIVPDAKRPATPGKPFPVWYTWAGSDERISDAGKLVDEGIAALAGAGAKDSAKRHDDLASRGDRLRPQFDRCARPTTRRIRHSTARRKIPRLKERRRIGRRLTFPRTVARLFPGHARQRFEKVVE